jgi:class 3 adenylate cyclase/TolB-like protein/ketosteroid isomerase-like protein
MPDSSADEPQQSRRLSAVLLADVTGYSRLMAQDEPRALTALNRVREVFAALVPRHGGTLDVFVGDCFVALFPSAVDAVQAAVAIQKELAAAAGPASDPVRIRIGIHLGEVVRAGNEIFGDSINIASRIQTIARPGGIAVSDDVHRAVRNKVGLEFRDLGLKTLKNIQGKVRVWEVELADLELGPRADAARPLRPLVLGAVGFAALAGVGLLVYQLALRPVAVAPPAATKQVASDPQQPVVVGVMGIAARGDVPDWMRDVTRDGLNTILSKVGGLRVFSRQKIDFVREKRGLSELEAAETLGIAKMLSGALVADGASIVLEVQVVDIATGLLDASERVEGKPGELIELQNHLAIDVLHAMRVSISPEERNLIFAKRTNETLDAYRMLADTLGDAGGAPAEAPPAPRRGGAKTSWLAWPRAAWAGAPTPDEAAIREVLEAYRAALQAKDLERLAGLHLDMDTAQRSSLERYFANAKELVVTLSNVDVLIEGDEALATFTWGDAFVDARSEKPIQLEVRLESVLARKDGGWKIRGVKRS